MNSFKKLAGTLAVLAFAVTLGLFYFTDNTNASAAETTLPFQEPGYMQGDSLEDYNDFIMSGGVPKDGIPSIDNPEFIPADEADMDPGDKIIGIVHKGEARAYPQIILVSHEIVNDTIQGENVAITYCPLTATAQGFKRGETELGVSGNLLNSNLVMYDRETDSYFPQITATGMKGEHRGKTLDEINLIWTTWERWREAHPDTLVLSERTGFLRNYNRDPYGSYNPLGGYYQQDRTMFPLMHEGTSHHRKEMVVGARTDAKSAFFVMEELGREGIQTTDNFLAVYDPVLDTGYIYYTGGDHPDLSSNPDGTYSLEGETFQPDELPLDQRVSVEAFYFAWHAFYPNSEQP